MTTENLQIRTSAVGTEQTRSRLNQVRGAVAGVGRATGGIFTRLLGGSLLTGLLGGSLIGLAVGGGEASNSMVRLQAALEDLIRPFLPLLNELANFLEGLSPVQRRLLLITVAVLLLVGVLKLLGFGALVTGLLALGAALGFGTLAFAGLLGAILIIVAGLYFLITRGDYTARAWERIWKFIARSTLGFANDIIDAINQVLTALGLVDDVVTGKITPAEAGRAVRAAGGDIFAQSAREGSRIPVRGLIPRFDLSGLTDPGGLGLSGLGTPRNDFERFISDLLNPAQSTFEGNRSSINNTFNQFYGLSNEQRQAEIDQSLRDPRSRGRAEGGP